MNETGSDGAERGKEGSVEQSVGGRKVKWQMYMCAVECTWSTLLTDIIHISFFPPTFCLCIKVIDMSCTPLFSKGSVLICLRFRIWGLSFSRMSSAHTIMTKKFNIKTKSSNCSVKLGSQLINFNKIDRFCFSIFNSLSFGNMLGLCKACMPGF